MSSVPQQRVPGEGQPDHAAGPDWNQAWAEALSALELDVERVETVLRAVHRGAELPAAADLLSARWAPPANLGPLPHPMLDRARRLLERQGSVVQQVAAASENTRKHVQLVQAISPPSRPAGPVYFDAPL